MDKYEEKDNYVRDHNTIARYVQVIRMNQKHLLLLQEQNGDMITPMGYECRRN